MELRLRVAGLRSVCHLDWASATSMLTPDDSVHRIGQEKPVFIKRLVVENTIEERMLRLQEVKTGLAEAALGEGVGGKLHKLSVKDIKYVRFPMALRLVSEPSC